MEEVELQEEMRWVKRFFLTCTEQWKAKVTPVETMHRDPAMAEGLHAFASEQAAQYDAMHSH